jgi:hypothetical protein
MNLNKRIIDHIHRTPLLVKPAVTHSLIAVPDQDIIDCEIETPQFKDGKVWKMYKQQGRFYKSDMKFIHNGLLNGHDVQFHNIEDFQKALGKVF